MAPSLALLAIPTYYLLVLWPHFYALFMIAGRKPEAFDNVNPRSKETAAAYQKLLGPRDFGRWERARAAASQGFETFPVVAAAMVIGLYAGVAERTVNITAAAILVLRVFYTLIYINGEQRSVSTLRSVVYLAQTAACMNVMFKAAFVYGS